MRSLIVKAGAALVIGFGAIAAHAAQDFYYLGTLYGSDGTIATYRTPLTGSIYKPMVDAQQTMMSQLRAYLVPQLMAPLSGLPGYQNGSASVDGPLSLTYSSGDVTFSGLRIVINATAKQSYAGVTATCNINLSLDPATTIVGRLDIVSGLLVAKEIKNFKLNPSYSCQTNLDWIPFVNTLVDAFISYKIDGLIAEKMQLAHNAIANLDELKPFTFMGLNAIPDSVFGAPGLNLAQLKNKIAGGFQNLPAMSVDIGDPKRRVYGPQGYPHQAGSHDLIMSIAIGNLRFELGEHRIYYDEMYCPPEASGRSCFPF